MQETGNSFLMGAMLSGSLHGAHKATPGELAGFGGIHGADGPLSPTERAALDTDVQTRMPIGMDTIARANVDGHFPLPKGYEFDAPNNRFIYTGLGESGPEDNASESALTKKKPLQKGEITTYEDFKKRSEKGDNLEGHELWQHANLKSHDLATERLSTDASKKNPVMVLDKQTHAQVNAAQRAVDASSQTPKQNIGDNVDILRKLRAAKDAAIKLFQQMSNQHSEKYIKPGTHEPK